MARPFWTFSQNNFMTGSLEIEYKATKLAIVEETDRQSASFYTLRYQQGNLASLPENICQFPNIVIIDFSKNKLKDLTNLCLNCEKNPNVVNMIGKKTKNDVFFEICFLTSLAYQAISNNIDLSSLSICSLKNLLSQY
jgi:hypothetical protein